LNFPSTNIKTTGSIPIHKFREMDYLSIDKYNIPIELMMENAGLNLARLAASLTQKTEQILIGIGTGNNGGGGLVAARRLAGWGYNVSLHLPDKNLKALPQLQLKRALAVGAHTENVEHPGIFIDAYLGFSQRLPLSDRLMEAVEKMNALDCMKISLDIPTGFNKQTAALLFKPDIILSLAAMKTELIPLLSNNQVFIADLGLPAAIYEEFGIKQPPQFSKSGVVECLS